MEDQGSITRAVNAIAAGQLPSGVDPAVDRLYQELRQLASSRLAHNPGASLQATELVHEAFLKLFRPGQQAWQSRAHFFGSAARAMQQLLIDRWRASAPHLLDLSSLDQLPSPEVVVHPLALGNAIDKLAALDPQIAEIVRFRVFAGLTVEQTAEALGLSERTVKRHFAFARTWLFQQLRGQHHGGSASGADAGVGKSERMDA